MAPNTKQEVKKRKLVVSMNVTLDGFLSGPNCELDWHFDLWTTDMAEALCTNLENADTLLFGRITYVAMAGYWGSRVMDNSCPAEDRAFVHMMNTYKKYVVTDTLTESIWNNSVLVHRTGAAAIVEQLKTQKGNNIMVYGSSKLVNSLIQLNTIDEYHLWIHPVAIGSGKALFSNALRHFRLISTQTFRSGVVLLIYRTAPV